MSLVHVLEDQDVNVGSACERQLMLKLTFALGDGPVAGVAGFAGFRLVSKVNWALFRGRELAGQGGNRWQCLALRHVTGHGRPLLRSRVHAAAQEDLPDSLHDVEAEGQLWNRARGLRVGGAEGAPAREADQ
jgi:hypothetical protein